MAIESIITRIGIECHGVDIKGKRGNHHESLVKKNTLFVLIFIKFDCVCSLKYRICSVAVAFTKLFSF